MFSEQMDLDSDHQSITSSLKNISQSLKNLEARNNPQELLLKDILQVVQALDQPAPCPPSRTSSLPAREYNRTTPCESCRAGRIELRKKAELDDLLDRCTRAESSADWTHRQKTELESRLARIQEALDAERHKSQELEQKLSSLNQLFVRAGRKDDTLIDSDIHTRFVILRGEIQALVRTHLTTVPQSMKRRIEEMGKNASRDYQDLYVRSKVAWALYDKFFDPNTSLYGMDDKERSFKNAEQRLKDFGASEEDLAIWRSIAVKTALKRGDYKQYDFVQVTADDLLHILERYQPTALLSSKKMKAACYESLLSICRQAYELALLLRSSKMEYQWQQQVVTDRADFSDADILGTTGVSQEEDYQVERVIFGGVYRGNRATGRLRDGSTLILKPGVIITYK